MTLAHQFASLSYCTRRQVGCIIVFGNFVVMSYNGTPPGHMNKCEHPDTNITLDAVVHAEINALNKIPSHYDLSNAVLFVTVSPCRECATEIIKRRVGTVIYDVMKNTNIGIPKLIENGIVVEQLSP